MSERRDQYALAIYCALVARDPLPTWRFLDLQRRFKEMSTLAVIMADDLIGALDHDAKAAMAEFAETWDRAADEAKPSPLVEKAERDMAQKGMADAIDKRRAAGLSHRNLFDE